MLRENRTSADVCIKDVIKRGGEISKFNNQKNFWFVRWYFPDSVTIS